MRDVLTTLKRRQPGIPVVLYPTPVQGEGAAQKIAEAIRVASERAECDVLIVCRGGGSIEDLWAFNDERVARAIRACRIPVVCGIGHETDFTIADFAADVRAATPTAAAELVTQDREALLQRLALTFLRLTQATARRLERSMQQVDILQRRLIHPAQRIDQQRQLLSHLQQRIYRARPDIARLAAQQADLQRRLSSAMRQTLKSHDARVNGLQQHLIHLDPEKVLSRGYSLVRDERGAIVADSRELSPGDTLNITFSRGWASVNVSQKGD